MVSRGWFIGLGALVAVSTLVWVAVPRQTTTVDAVEAKPSPASKPPHTRAPTLPEHPRPTDNLAGGSAPADPEQTTDRAPRMVRESEWSALGHEERVESAREQFEDAVAEGDLDHASSALSVLRSELYPERKHEYEQLERVFDQLEQRTNGEG